MTKSIAIIDAHPDADPARFCHALVAAYKRGAESSGHHAAVIDLATMDIPLLKSASEFTSGKVPPDIAGAQDVIRGADHIVIVYPLWLGTMPALLKAFLEQTMRPGFAMDSSSTRSSAGWPMQLLTGRSARIVVTMGIPAFIYRWYYGAHSLKSLERNVLNFVGIRPVRETLIGAVEAISESQRLGWIAKLETLGSQAR